MKTLTVESMELIEGGGLSLVAKACVILGTGSIVYGAGLAFNWWNPIGWVSAGALSGDFLCLMYGYKNAVAAE